ncbi:MAG: hypothetical protein KC420_12995 [Myxococcales bacterium]|nr:hypothetical protein [Myxococcales bacterium]MCB9706260.1 hypothetical protein [Myxococcales bacterium]
MVVEVVNLRPESQAEQAAFTALLDLADLLADSPIDVSETRVIGGHMVELHIARHNFPRHYSRMTLDSDFGLDKVKLLGLDLRALARPRESVRY